MPTPAINDISGVKNASARPSLRLSRTNVSLAFANVARARGSIAYARTTVIPARCSCTRVDRTPSCVCTSSLR